MDEGLIVFLYKEELNYNSIDAVYTQVGYLLLIQCGDKYTS